MPRKYILLALPLILVLLFIAFWSGGRRREPLSGVRLVLVLIVDQLPQRSLEELEPHLSGGLKLLLDKGAVFSNAKFTHASTHTCPGHAALFTGTPPSANGIIANSWYDRKARRKIDCDADPRYHRSPKNLLVEGLGDWLKTREGSKVFAASGKGRTAVIMGGRRPNGAFWYRKGSGNFASSDYYSSEVPGWVKKFNARRSLLGLFGTPWQEFQGAEEVWQKLGWISPDEGAYPKGFPHPLGGPAITPTSGFFRDIYNSPFIDEYLADFAEHLLTYEQLGEDEQPDLLALSFSVADRVGHEYGPKSREYLDVIRRLDARLAKLFDYIENRIGLKHTLIVLASDHGAQDLPEVAQGEARRMTAEDIACIQSVGKRLSERYGVTNLFSADWYFNDSVLKKHRLAKDDVSFLAKEWLERCQMVERVWLPSELKTKTSDDPVRNRFADSFRQERSPDLIIQYKRDYLPVYFRGTSHGSGETYDSHVPLIFLHPSIQAKTVVDAVNPLDVAPTLAAFLGLDVPKYVEGRDLRSLIAPGA